MNKKTNRFLALLALAITISLGAASNAQAQRAPGALGLGLQLGEPSGISLTYYQPEGMSYDFLSAWNLSNDFFFLNAHGLFNRHLGNDQNLHLYYGPGAFVGFQDRNGDNQDTVAGISGRIGLGYLIDRFEIYGQLTPRLSVTPGTDGDLGGGVGFRYYF
jgi:hypothetical protein